MLFPDAALSQRLERAEGYACVQHAAARQRIHPESGAAWMACSGAHAVFDGIDSPLTQTFGLGISEELKPETLEAFERFFIGRGAPVLHEVSPHAGVAALDLLCARGYRPVEISNVMYRPVEAESTGAPGGITVRAIGTGDAQLWADTSARAWSHDHPEFLGFLREFGSIAAAREGGVCFLAEIDGVPGAAGAISICDGVALFAGSATVPEMRRRGLQAALLHHRMSFAFEHGCDLAMMVAHPGSDSQRNAERKGFNVAYTRTKWRLMA